MLSTWSSSCASCGTVVPAASLGSAGSDPGPASILVVVGVINGAAGEAGVFGQGRGIADVARERRAGGLPWVVPSLQDSQRFSAFVAYPPSPACPQLAGCTNLTVHSTAQLQLR